jgi:hypothetical protein
VAFLAASAAPKTRISGYAQSDSASVDGSASPIRTTERFDQARLTEAFSNLRKRSVDMLPPNLKKEPEITEGKELHLVGNFPTQPLQVQFEMFFLQLDGVWRLNGLSVDAVPAETGAIAAANPPAPQESPAVSNRMLDMNPKTGAAP